MVVGCLYNGDNEYPFKPPPKLSQSGWRTTTHPDGPVLQEFIFEDKSGAEEIYTFAGRNYRRKVTKDEIVDIDETLKKHVAKDADYKYDQKLTTEVGNDAEYKYDKKLTVHVKDDADHTYDKKLTTHVKHDAELQVDQGIKATINQAIEINGKMDAVWTTSAALTIESKTKLVLKVAGSTIELTPAGIAITGPLVRINS